MGTVRSISWTDFKFVYNYWLHLHHFQIPPVYLTMQRSLYDQSCHLPDFLAPTSCQFTHSIAVCFFNLVCGWFLFFLWVFTLRFLKKLQDLVYTAVEISCCVALCTIDAIILCLTFAQHVLPTHLVTKQLLSTLDLISLLLWCRCYTYVLHWTLTAPAYVLHLKYNLAVCP